MEKGSMKAEDYHSYDTCNYEESKVFLWIENYFILDTEDENEIKEILYSNGPLAIAINADTFQYYISGIIDDDKYSCEPEGLNHAAVLVGYVMKMDLIIPISFLFLKMSMELFMQDLTVVDFM